MAHHTLSRTLKLLIGVLMILALVPSMALAQDNGATLASTTLPSLSGTLNAGENAVFTFVYPGDNSEVGFFLAYAPVASITNGSQDDGPILEGFLPTAPPPADPIGRVTQDVSGHPGTRLWTLRSRDAGTYTLVVTNADVQSRTITFTLTSAAKTPTGLFDVAGPTLAQVSGPQVPPETVTTEVLAAPLPPTGTTVAGVLGAGENTVITFSYSGDNREVHFNLGYSPTPTNQDPSVEDGLILESFGPDTPTSGDPIGRATSDLPNQPGNRLLTLRSRDAGTYTLVLTNADRQSRQINFTLTTTVDNGSGDFVIPGPELTVVFAGEE